ncbi:hypothetical protein LAG90_02470 [Marinilongibacter aquaticus]|uniref:hypothetical protein n=1 Tax=Marinilongibacter aquaticus TaxID=2975157 RepID=UPI0035B5D516|nr:hypothetical protein LAG90_02470 [Marinilongibacter aquaticus]
MNLYEYGYRWHDPAMGRFIQVDPLAEEKTACLLFRFRIAVYLAEIIHRLEQFCSKIESTRKKYANTHRQYRTYPCHFVRRHRKGDLGLGKGIGTTRT